MKAHIKNIIKVTFLLNFTVFYLFAFSQNDIPEADVNKQAPYKVSKETLQKGELVFNNNCKSCHGEYGTGNVAKINPLPPDFGAVDYEKLKDGEAFYIITHGKSGVMPAFENVLSEEQRWQTVIYINHFGEIEDKSIGTENYNIRIELNEKEKIVNVVVNKLNEQKQQARVAGVRVDFFVKRIFGDLTLAKAVMTNKNGYASVKFPHDLPGDTIGNVEIIVKFTDEKKFAGKSDSKIVNWGTKLNYKNPLEERAMWGTRKNAPLWVLFSYLSVTIGVWLVIFYVIFNITKIKDAGKQE